MNKEKAIRDLLNAKSIDEKAIANSKYFWKNVAKEAGFNFTDEEIEKAENSEDKFLGIRMGFKCYLI
jgi:hypothetical protein